MIKNQDGTPYELRKPNPLMKNQESWKSNEEIELHNCAWEKTITTPKQTAVKPIEGDFNIRTSEIKDDFIPIMEAQIEPEPEPLPELEPEPLPEQLKIPKTIDQKIVIIHCLPAIIQIIKDALYGDERENITYGAKFTFEGIIVNRNDLTLQFWTNLQLIKNSIIFPSKYKTGIKFGGYRWWEVVHTELKTGGYITHCVPSQLQPDFTEITI